MTSNPSESNKHWHAHDFDMVVFGGTGDLAMRKLMPALLHREMDEQLSADSRIFGIGRSKMSDVDYAARVEENCRKQLGKSFDEKHWAAFTKRLHYVAVDAAADRGFEDLAEKLGTNASKIRVFYLATAPDLFGTICRSLGANGMVHLLARVVLEKTDRP